MKVWWRVSVNLHKPIRNNKSEDWQPSGQVFYKWVDPGDPSRFTVVALNFWDTNEFKQLREWARITGLSAFDLSELLQIGHIDVITRDAIPNCPDGHGKMKMSKKFNGWFCPFKLPNGNYCDKEIRE